MPFVTMDDDSDDTMDPSMGETTDTNVDVPVQNGSMGTNEDESINDIWFTIIDDQETNDDDDEETNDDDDDDDDDDSLSWISVEENNPTTWRKIKNVLIVIGILGLITGGSIAAVYLASAEIKLKDKEIQVRAQMMTSIPWDDTLKYKNSKFYQMKSAESKENLGYDFSDSSF